MDRCLTLREFERRVAGELSPQEQEAFDHHIAECEECRQAYEEGAELNRFLLRMKSVLGRKDGAVDGGAPTIRSGSQKAEGPQSINASVPHKSSAREYLPRIEGYVIHRVLGRGGMGVVYEAVQTKLNRTVALKLLPAIVSSSHPQTIERFHREAAAAAKLHHRNIISIYDFGESRDGYYYAMELIDGQPFNTLIKRLAADATRHDTEDSIAALLRASDFGSGPALPDSGGPTGATPGHDPSSTAEGRFFYTQVAHWTAQVADALQYAHLNGLVHRDIKPSNLMLATDGRILVLDFGLVKSSGDESVTVSGSLIGTYRYMSPEQLGAKRIPVDARTDIYSLGATLYELLTSQPAFRAMERPALLSEIMFREPTAPRKIIPSVPPELENICLKAIEKSPEARYQSAGLMAKDLRRYINDLPIIARRPGALRRAYKFLRRHRVGASAVTTIVLLTAAATAISIKKEAEVRRKEAEVRRQEAEVRQKLLEKGAAHMDSESWEEARRVLQGLLGTKSYDLIHAKALLNLAIMKKDEYYREGDKGLLREADAYLDEANRVGIDPKRRATLTIRGIIRRSQRRLDQAERILREALDTKDDSANPHPKSSIWTNLGSVYALMGDLGEAERCLLQARDTAENQKRTKSGYYMQGPGRDTWYNLAVIQLHLGKQQAPEMLEVLDNAWKWTRKHGKESMLLRPEIKLLQAKLYLTLDAHDQALKAAITADEIGEADDPQAVIKRYLALAELRSQRWRPAINAAGQALRLRTQAKDSNDRLTELDVERTYAYLIMALARAHLGERTMARDYLKEALDHWPDALQKPEDFAVTEKAGKLWIDSADELLALRAEAEELVGVARGDPRALRSPDPTPVRP